MSKLWKWKKSWFLPCYVHLSKLCEIEGKEHLCIKSYTVSNHLLASMGGCCELAGGWDCCCTWTEDDPLRSRLFSTLLIWFWFDLPGFLMNDLEWCSVDCWALVLEVWRMVLQTPAEMKQKRRGRIIVNPIHPGFDRKKERTWVAAGRCSLAEAAPAFADRWSERPGGTSWSSTWRSALRKVKALITKARERPYNETERSTLLRLQDPHPVMASTRFNTN